MFSYFQINLDAEKQCYQLYKQGQDHCNHPIQRGKIYAAFGMKVYIF